MDKCLEAVQISAVALEAQESEDTVISILSGIRDAVLEQVKKNNVVLSSQLGSLHLRQNGQIEFKPCPIAEITEKKPIDDKIPYSAEFDKTTNLKQGSLIAKDQASNKSKDAQSRYSQRAGSTAPVQRAMQSLDNSRNLFGSLKGDETPNKRDLTHLADFLKSQTMTLSSQKPQTPLTGELKANHIGLSQLRLNKKLQKDTDLVFLNNRHRHVNNLNDR